MSSLIITQQARTIDALDGCVVNGSQRALVYPVVGSTLHVHFHQLLTYGLQCSPSRCIGLDVHVQIKAIILTAEQRLLVLILPHMLHTNIGSKSVSEVATHKQPSVTEAFSTRCSLPADA